jgi:16S rRNA (cytidine1402-2'-O)-methyltransferase
MPIPGALVLVATPIGNLGDLTPRAIEALRTADVIAAEDTRRTRALLTHAGVSARGRLRAVHGHNEHARARAIVDEIRGGARVAYVTDAGMPGISDPGARLVRACVDAGMPVEIVPGPSAALTGLVLSGLPTERFVFEGFLPRKGKARAERLTEIAHEARTIVLFEAPNRVRETLADLAAACGAVRRIAIARELTKMHETVWRGTAADAVAQVQAEEPRGEHVIVVGPAPETAPPTDDELAAEARGLVEEGLSTRAAADELAARWNVSRRRAYQIVIDQQRER